MLLACGRSHGVDAGEPDGGLDAARLDASVDAALAIPAPSCSATCTETWVDSGSEEEDRILALVAERERSDYDAWIGRYVCGDDPRAVYAGELDARDDRGDFETAYQSGVISGPVVGTLDVQWPPPWNGHARLTLHAEDGLQWRVQHAPESPEWAESSAVEPSNRTVPAHSAGCRGCMPFMADFPEQIEVAPFEMDAIVGAWRVWGEGGRLRRVDPDDITLAQLETLAGAYGPWDEFRRSADAWRRAQTGSIEELLDATREGFDACFRVTDYVVGEAIGAACPASHALGPLQILGQRTCCDRQVFIEDCDCDVPFRTERECD